MLLRAQRFVCHCRSGRCYHTGQCTCLIFTSIVTGTVCPIPQHLPMNTSIFCLRGVKCRTMSNRCIYLVPVINDHGQSDDTTAESSLAFHWWVYPIVERSETVMLSCTFIYHEYHFHTTWEEYARQIQQQHHRPQTPFQPTIYIPQPLANDASGSFCVQFGNTRTRIRGMDL